MSRSSRHKDTYGRSTEMSQDKQYEGTAARTRPFSFDEIMSKRKNKKASENLEGELKDTLGGVINEKASDHRSERGNGHNEESSTGARLHLSEEHGKASYRKKEDKVSMKEDFIAKGKDRDVRDSEAKSKAKMNEDMRTEVKEKANEKIHDRRKRDKRPGNFSESEAVKKHSREVEKDTHVGKSRGKSERERKEKYRNGIDDKSRDRNAAKKHDLGKGHHLEASERRERKESSKSHNEEIRLKRTRSRSREHEDRNRRSISLSPRAHKHGSYHKREHAELSSPYVKERSGRQQFDAENSKTTNSSSSRHHRRHGGSASGLGGYSPRKRKSEAAVKTPSPAKRSPEKKNAKWDLAPEGKNNVFPAVILSNFESQNQTASSNIHEVVSAVPVVSAPMKPLSEVSPGALSTAMKVCTESIKLTQATHPMKRLYIENIPASASEKAVMDRLNNFLISSGVKHIQGTQPCISCIMQKEKGRALVEFLTPEDASAALSFDGCSFSGSIIKVRWPKDSIEVTDIYIGCVIFHVLDGDEAVS
ncbi:splicing factor U2af [Salix suchowensis]|nr:splicing factor U2af [Salix suchowensis]